VALQTHMLLAASHPRRGPAHPSYPLRTSVAGGDGALRAVLLLVVALDAATGDVLRHKIKQNCYVRCWPEQKMQHYCLCSGLEKREEVSSVEFDFDRAQDQTHLPVRCTWLRYNQIAIKSKSSEKQNFHRGPPK